MKSNNKSFIFGILGVVVVAIAIGIFIVFQSSQQNAPTVTGEQLQVSEEFLVNDTGFAVSNDGKLLTQEEVDDYPTVVDIYQDFLCSYCADFTDSNEQEMLNYQEANPEEVIYVYHILNFMDNENTNEYSTRAASAAITVLMNEPELFNSFNLSLFEAQPTGPADSRKNSAALAALDKGIGEELTALIASEQYKEWVANNTDSVFSEGLIQGTPAIFINGENIGGGWQNPGMVTLLEDAAQ